MADSIVPALREWWRSNGQQRDADVFLPAGASTTPYDGSAVPAGSRRFTFEIVYSADAGSQLDLRVNWFSKAKKKISGPFDLKSVLLAVGQGATVVAEVELPANPSPLWLPSVGVPAAASDVLLSSLKVYETPVPQAPAGPSVTVWDGGREVAATVTVWDGEKEIPVSIEIQA
ncbi:hypothetical protein [Actinomyces oris]|uniref:hypothetical protein n=1 Tax=Actinomyces oris TaxID=544580 RepID=UPI00094DA831|nr:hypothetical protein [Actinomyces oris]OLO74862.1 hypothetical protein BKH16_10110 [Actinomyces oris]